MEGLMLSAAGLSPASESLAFAALAVVCVFVALLTVWALRTVRRERAGRVAAERATAQSHRLAQTSAAFGHARTSTDAIATAIHEPLHWLRAGSGVFFLLSDDRQRLTVARAVGYQLDHRESWKIDAWGAESPFAESLRRLAPIVIKSAESRPSEYDTWSKAGPWKDHEAALVLPIAADRHVIGFLQIDFDAPREFSTDDHEFIHMRCSVCAVREQSMWMNS